LASRWNPLQSSLLARVCSQVKALDTIRWQSRFNKTIAQHGELLAPGIIEIEDMDEKSFNDDHLRLIFTCCHPALSIGAEQNDQIRMSYV